MLLLLLTAPGVAAVYFFSNKANISPHHLSSSCCQGGRRSLLRKPTVIGGSWKRVSSTAKVGGSATDLPGRSSQGSFRAWAGGEAHSNISWSLMNWQLLQRSHLAVPMAARAATCQKVLSLVPAPTEIHQSGCWLQAWEEAWRSVDSEPSVLS